MASDRTSQTGEATAGFVQRPTIPPRSRRVISHSPLEIAAEYRAIVMFTKFLSTRTRSRNAKVRARRITLESLETRQMLSGGGLPPPVISAVNVSIAPSVQ